MNRTEAQELVDLILSGVEVRVRFPGGFERVLGERDIDDILLGAEVAVLFEDGYRRFVDEP